MVDASDRSSPTNLRGWLSDVYFPSLIARETEPLLRRLGNRATVDDPVFGRVVGPNALARRLEEVTTWLGMHAATFDRSGFVMGSDRDLTEGTLELAVEGRRVAIPVAVMAERRREREVELRIYHSTKGIRGAHSVRPPLLAQDDETTVPPPVAAYIDALERGDLAAAVGSFENGATVRDAEGQWHPKQEGGGPLEGYCARLIGSDGSPGSGGGARVVKNARADNGRTCVLEYTMLRVRGRDAPPQAGLAVFERGESGLLHALRVYDDIEF